MPKTTETLIASILAELVQIGPGGALWGEADGDAGYLVRPDGAVLGIGDYQAVDKEGTLQELDRGELGRILGDLVPWSQLEDEEERLFSAAHVAWLQGGAYHEGPLLTFAGAYNSASFNTPMQLSQDIEWRGQDHMFHQLPAGTPVMVQVTKSGMGPVHSLIDPQGGAGMTLELDASLLQRRPAPRPAGP